MLFIFHSLVIAKLDVLDTFKEVKIGIAYKYRGQFMKSFPGMIVGFVALCPSVINWNRTTKFHFDMCYGMYLWQMFLFTLMFVTACVEVLDEVEVEYITLPGWMTSIEQCRTFDALPPNAQAYITKIEQITQIPGEINRLSEM